MFLVCLHSRLLFYALGREKILSGLKTNFWCPAFQFPHSRHILYVMQRYKIFKAIPNLLAINRHF